MNDDILKSYFESKKPANPQKEFQQRLIENLTIKIDKYERSKKIIFSLITILSIIALIFTASIYIDIDLSSLFSSFYDSFSSMNMINTNLFLQFTISLIVILAYIYFLSYKELKRLKDELKEFRCSN